MIKDCSTSTAKVVFNHVSLTVAEQVVSHQHAPPEQNG
jgi:hypothetical protein